MDFSVPVNLGPGINTPGNEITPFYDYENSTLYFSSDGHVSLGGYDVFKSEGTFGQWGEVENMGFPVSSSADDMYYIRELGSGDVYLVSNRAARYLTRRVWRRYLIFLPFFISVRPMASALCWISRSFRAMSIILNFRLSMTAIP